MLFDELMALLGTDDAPETIYDDLRNSHNSAIDELSTSHAGIIGEKDSQIAQLQATIDTLKSQLFDAESNPDAGNQDGDNGNDATNENITIEDLFK